jgi:hypothetical protein
MVGTGSFAQESEGEKAKKNPFGEDGIYVSLRVGTTVERMRSEGYIDRLNFADKVHPHLSAMLDFDFDELVPEVRGMTLRLEVGYKPLHLYARNVSDRIDEKYELKAQSYAISGSILYRLPLPWKVRPYGGIGFGGFASDVSVDKLTVEYKNSNSQNVTVVYDRYMDLDGDRSGLLYTIGCMLGNRYDLNAKVLKSKWERTDEVHNKLRNTSIIISFGYRL